jgi:hypothetical protein
VNSVQASLLIFFGLFFGFYALMFLGAWLTRNDPCPVRGCLCKSWTCNRCGQTWEIEGINWLHNQEPLRSVSLEHMRRCW